MQFVKPFSLFKEAFFYDLPKTKKRGRSTAAIKKAIWKVIEVRQYT